MANHTPEQQLAAFARSTRLAALPALPRAGRASKPLHPCFCGCGLTTRSVWHSGHDGRATGWAVRIEKGLMKLEDVPANERKGAEFMLNRRSEEAAKAAKVG